MCGGGGNGGDSDTVFMVFVVLAPGGGAGLDAAVDGLGGLVEECPQDPAGREEDLHQGDEGCTQEQAHLSTKVT